MHRDLPELFRNNALYAEQQEAARPGYFRKLARLQRPRYFWIGCADSRVVANELTGLLPGELFVHRNVANLMVPGDLNAESALQFAVDALGVSHVIVCGHYGCGGVQAVIEDAQLGRIDAWLANIHAVRRRHEQHLAEAPNAGSAVQRLCELNALEQARHVADHDVLQSAWQQGRAVTVHAWIYAVSDGRLRDIGFSVSSPEEAQPYYEKALGRLVTRPFGEMLSIPDPAGVPASS